MATLKKADFLEAVKQMSVMDLVELIEAMEDEFKVSAAAVQVAAPQAGGGGGAAQAEAQTEFTVVLKSFGENKVNVIKVVREVTGLGLKEAKDLVEAAPSSVKEGIAEKDAQDIKKKLEEAGAAVEIK